MEIPSLAELQASLQRKHKNEDNNVIAMEFFKNGLLYFVEGNAKCWWCSSETNEAAMEMLHLFSIQETAQVKRLKDSMAEQLSRCTSCVSAYYEAKVRLRERYRKQYDLDRVDSFFKGVEAWDAGRIVAVFSRTTNAKDGVTGRIALYDALRAKENLLFHADVAETATCYIKTCLDSGNMLNMGSRLLPGFFTLCFSTDQRVRGWAWRSLKLASSKGSAAFEAESVTLVFAGVLQMLARIADPNNPYPVAKQKPVVGLDEVTFEFSADDVWRGLHTSLGRLSKSAREDLVGHVDGFPVIVCKSLLGIAGLEFIYAIRAFSIILGSAEKKRVWPLISSVVGSCSAADIAMLAINHIAIRGRFRGSDPAMATLSDNTLLLANRHAKPALDWITPFIESLCLPQDHAAIEALLIGLLFGIRSDSAVQIAYSAIAVHTALAIIKHCFKLPTAEKMMPDGSFVLSKLLSSNMHVILEIAQGRDPLSESELLISGTEDLIDVMLQDGLDCTFRAFSGFSEMAQAAQKKSSSQPTTAGGEVGAPPVLIHLPVLWAGVLKDPQNTNIAKKALYATSYLLLFDPLPPDLTKCLPRPWRDAYARFESERRDISILLDQLLQVLSSSLQDVDIEARMDFEQDILSSLLRHLVSPTEMVHDAILQILRPASLDSSDDEDQAAYNRRAGFSDTERDLVCYELFKRYGDRFFECLTEIASDCKVLVSHSRPAYSCSANIARLGRSSISAVSDSIGSRSSEAMARLFFAFCSLLGSILHASSDDAIQAGGQGIYSASVLEVFKTVYNMLNTVEFSGIVRMVKDSSRLDEAEAMDALSTCVSQMLNYLVGGDELGVAAGIIKTFGLVAGGLAATPGTSMLYPIETVQALIDGESGNLAPDLRRLLSTITKQAVWEPRSIVASKTKPVQIIIDDDEAFPDLNGLDLMDIMDDTPVDSAEAIAYSQPSHHTPSYDFMGGSTLRSMRAMEPSGSLQTQEKPAKTESPSLPQQEVQIVQLTPADAVAANRRKQVSMEHWFARAKTGSASLTSQVAPKTAAAGTKKPAASSAAASKKAKSGSGGAGLLSQMRSSFAHERKDMQLNQKPKPALKQSVKAPRSLSTVPANKWDSRRAMDIEEDDGAGLALPIYVRNASKTALAELEREQKSHAKSDAAKSSVPATPDTTAPASHHRGSAYTSTDESDESSSDDGEDDKGENGGLAGLIKIRKTPAKAQPKRSIKFISLNGGTATSGMRSHGGGSVFFDQQARDRAIAEQKAKMRLTPSMSILHKRLLGWKYEEEGALPPDTNLSELAKIPDQFADCSEYARVFEPLLLLECWAQFQRAKEETMFSEPCEAVLQSRMSEDDFQDITYLVSVADAKDMVENDVVVFAESMSREKRYAQGIPAIGMGNAGVSSGKPSSAQAPGINSRFAGRQTFLAKVQNRVFGKDSVQVVVRVFFQGARLALFLNKLVLKSMWEFFKLYSLTPMHREYAALRSLPYLNEKLVEEVLAPRPIVHEALGRLEVQECMKTHALNQPQAEAVVSAIKRDHGFTLIQGPPGTGKTKTILGLSGALLSRDKQRESAEDSNAGNERDPKPRKRNNKLLICAPSNAAVDEIVKRLKSGIRDEKGRTFHPSVVRVGLSDSISSTVRDTTLDFLMEKALNAFQVGQDDETGEDRNMASKDGGISAAQNNLLLSVAGRNHREGKVVNMAANAKQEHRMAIETQKSLRRQLDMVNEEIRELDSQMQSIDPSDASAMRELRDKFRQTNEKKKSIYQRLDTERGRAREASKTIDATKHKIRLQILQKTDILCCTLSGSGHDILTSINCTFDTVIIDEAAQSVELSCLIPLKYGCERCILVGDPNQLPPTVLSQAAAQHMYNQSMFVRIQKSSPESVNLLSIQYRMHPEISVFPSRLFYESRLKDGPEMAKKQTAPWHANPKYPPFMFFNIWMGKEQAGRSHSVFNTAEADAAVQLVQNICRDYPNVEFKQKIGVITPYKQQLRVLTEKFTKSFGAKVTDAIEFNTVDGFQGQEKEIIIFSCVRAGGSGVGFLADERRMNVGLTRARKSLFILGNSNMLVVSPLWKSLIDDATRRDLLKDSPLPLFGRHTSHGLPFDNLLNDAARKEAGDGDGEGDRAEFIMEKLDDSALKRLNDAIARPDASKRTDSRLGSDADANSDSDSDSDTDSGDSGDAADGRKRKHSALQEMAATSAHSKSSGSGSGSGDDRKRIKVSRKPGDRHPEHTGVSHRQESSSDSPSAAKARRVPHPASRPVAVAIPVGGHKRQQSPHVEAAARGGHAASSRPALTAAMREKQRSSLFIPKKGRRGRGGGPVPHSAPTQDAHRSEHRAAATPVAVPSVVTHPETNSRQPSRDRSDPRTSTSQPKARHKRKGGLFRPPVDTDTGSRRGRGGGDSSSSNRDDMISEMLERRR